MLKKIFASILALCSISATPAQNNFKTAPSKKTLLWEISGNGLHKPSYLFGTFHIICSESLHISSSLKAVIANANSVYFEMDMDDPENTFGAMKYMTMNNDTTLSMLMSKEDYEKASRFFRDSLHVNIAMIERMKPSFSSALVFPSLMSCKKMTGVETELMKIAKENKKEIKGFENITFQASVFDKTSYKDQAADMVKMIDNLTESKASFEKMMQAYLNQDLKAIEKTFENEPGFEKTKEELLINRNKNWVVQLDDILKSENIFIAVGAGHLVGKDGLINLLIEKGYKLRAIEN